jgi:predicted nucleotidyltransferase
MIYSIEDIKRIVEPIAERHGVKRVWLFGSFARGEQGPIAT